MKTLKETIEQAAKTAKRNTKVNDTLEERWDYLTTLLDIEIPRAKIITCAKEKPCAGAAFSVIELSDRFRVNYRCGYSRHNYAPCVEILK
jgi:hypothetical protein